MDKNTMVFLLVAFLVIMVVAFLLWKNYSESRPATNRYDAISAWADSAARAGDSFFSNFWGLGKKKN